MHGLSRRTLAAFALVVTFSPARARAGAEGAGVDIENFTFTPAELTIKPGTTVTWKNEDDIPHTVVGKGREFRSKPLDTGDSFSYSFAAPGRFDYFCSLHPHMVGTIVVAP